MAEDGYWPAVDRGLDELDIILLFSMIFREYLE